jgi:serine/threonine protein phosphatase PrpC
MGGELCFFSHVCPGHTDNGDAMAFLTFNKSHGLLVLADGAGGTPKGNDCSGLLVNAITEAFAMGRSNNPDPSEIRNTFLDAVEWSHHKIQKQFPKGGTTLSALEIGPNYCRAYVIGDSAILISGQRGKRKFQSLAHSPTGFAVQAGFLDEDEALNHPERSLVLNLLGMDDWSIGVSGASALDERDTILICSDGLTDNLTTTEIIECIRKGPLLEAAESLSALATQRMLDPNGPYHAPDDLSFALYRRNSPSA